MCLSLLAHWQKASDQLVQNLHQVTDQDLGQSGQDTGQSGQENNEEIGMDYTIKKQLSQDYVKEDTHKNLIVLHYTAGGTLSGAKAWLDKRDYVNVHYFVDRDGTIVQSIPEQYWAYHTGKGKKADKPTIGIEIVAWGQLTRVGNELRSWTGKKIPWNEVLRLKPFRGYEYFHALTPEQFGAVEWLVNDIRKRWSGIKTTTHARLNTGKLDFPPDYPGIRKLVDA